MDSSSLEKAMKEYQKTLDDYMRLSDKLIHDLREMQRQWEEKFPKEKPESVKRYEAWYQEMLKKCNGE